MPSNLISLLVKPIFILVSQANPNDIVKFFTEFAKHISMDFCTETVMRNPGFLIEERSDSSLLRLRLNFFLFIAAYKQYT